jgi:hypothetical protein
VCRCRSGSFLYIALAVLEFRYSAAWRKLLVFDMLFPSFLCYVFRTVTKKIKLKKSCNSRFFFLSPFVYFVAIITFEAEYLSFFQRKKECKCCLMRLFEKEPKPNVLAWMDTSQVRNANSVGIQTDHIPSYFIETGKWAFRSRL